VHEQENEYRERNDLARAQPWAFSVVGKPFELADLAALVSLARRQDR